MILRENKGALLYSRIEAPRPARQGTSKQELMDSKLSSRRDLIRRTALQKYLLIAVGGALGSIARYWVGTAVSARMGLRFPYGTFVVNLTACLIIGFSLTFLGRRADFNPAWRFLIPVGFIGAYSTFSTYEWETLTDIRSGAFAIAALYAIGSLVVGLAATWCGAALAEALS